MACEDGTSFSASIERAVLRLSVRTRHTPLFPRRVSYRSAHGPEYYDPILRLSRVPDPQHDGGQRQAQSTANRRPAGQKKTVVASRPKMADEAQIAALTTCASTPSEVGANRVLSGPTFQHRDSGLQPNCRSLHATLLLSSLVKRSCSVPRGK